MFVDLHAQGLLYRDKRLVNWDPGLKTAISDLEVETREINGSFWHLSYPLEDGSGAISVATTRPETMLADMAVAVNPEDERYTALIGRNVRLPITGRLVPIIADEHADPTLGSGAVKITPGHDFNDFEVGKRAGFKPADMLNMLDAEAKLVQTADGLIPADYLGLSVREAREKVVAALEAARRARKGRAARDPDALWRSLGRGDRAVADRPMVCRRQDPRRPRDRGGPLGRHPRRARDVEEDLVSVAGEYPAVVRVAPAVVGAPDPGLVWAEH